MSRPKFIAVDFFCGAGGTTRGLSDAGGLVIAGVDKDASCGRTYLENNRRSDGGDLLYLNRDIFPKSRRHPGGRQRELTVELDAAIAAAKRRHPGVPLLFAICAPCQPFTTLSRAVLSESRTAARDRDRSLLLESAKFVRRYRPEMVLCENVSGIREARYGGVWEAFAKTIGRAGYASDRAVVDASAFGVPQIRRRSILLAVRNRGAPVRVPLLDPGATAATVRETIGHLPPIAAGELHPDVPNHLSRALSELNLKRIAAAVPGASNAYLEKTEYGDLSLPCHRRVFEKIGERGFGDTYTRMHPDRPSPTIRTTVAVSNGRFGHYDPAQLRGISLREAALLQSFPMDYVFHPTAALDAVARQIGNAVPPRLAKFMAERLSAIHHEATSRTAGVA